jgi:GTPase SAR1 family protein
MCHVVKAGAHERYRGLRSSFYADISGVIIVYDSTSARCVCCLCAYESRALLR